MLSAAIAMAPLVPNILLFSPIGLFLTSLHASRSSSSSLCLKLSDRGAISSVSPTNASFYMYLSD